MASTAVPQHIPDMFLEYNRAENQQIRHYLDHRYQIEWQYVVQNGILHVSRRLDNGQTLPKARFSKVEVIRIYRLRFHLHDEPEGTFVNVAAALNKSRIPPDDPESEPLPAELFAAVYLFCDQERHFTIGPITQDLWVAQSTRGNENQEELGKNYIEVARRVWAERLRLGDSWTQNELEAAMIKWGDVPYGRDEFDIQVWVNFISYFTMPWNIALGAQPATAL